MIPYFVSFDNFKNHVPCLFEKLDNIFRPRRIALIGVNNDPKSISGITLRNLMESGFSGVIYPVDAKREAVLGIPCYPRMDSLPKKPDFGCYHVSGT